MQYAQYIATCVRNVTGKNRKEEINWKICKLMKCNIEMEKQVLNISLLNSTGLRQDALTDTMINVSRTRDNC